MPEFDPDKPLGLEQWQLEYETSTAGKPTHIELDPGLDTGGGADWSSLLATGIKTVGGVIQTGVEAATRPPATSPTPPAQGSTPPVTIVVQGPGGGGTPGAPASPAALGQAAPAQLAAPASSHTGLYVAAGLGVAGLLAIGLYAATRPRRRGGGMGV